MFRFTFNSSSSAGLRPKCRATFPSGSRQGCLLHEHSTSTEMMTRRTSKYTTRVQRSHRQATIYPLCGIQSMRCRCDKGRLTRNLAPDPSQSEMQYAVEHRGHKVEHSRRTLQDPAYSGPSMRNRLDHTQRARLARAGRNALERLRHTSVELRTPLVPEKNAQHSQDLPWEAEVRRPSPDHRKADPLKSLRQVQDQGHSSLFFCLQDFPHCALSSSVTTIRGVPLPAILLLPLCHFWRSQGFPPASQSWHERNRPFTCDILRNQEEHRRAGLLRPFFALHQLLQELHGFSSCLFCQVQGNFRVESVAHPTPVFTLYNLDAFSRSPSFNLGNTSSHSWNYSFFQGLFCTLSSHCQCFAHSFLFASQRSNNLASSSSIFRICTPLLHIVGLVILWRRPALPSALLVIFSTLR